jgi:hypothetical protein
MTKRKVISILEKAQALIRKGWCQMSLAKDKHGYYCKPKSKKAVRWCLEGALIRAGANEGDWPWSFVIEACETNQSLWIFNDHNTRGTVLRRLRRAILNAKKAGKCQLTKSLGNT